MPERRPAPERRNFLEVAGKGGAKRMTRSTSSLTTINSGERRVSISDRRGGRRRPSSGGGSDVGSSGQPTPMSQCSTPTKRSSKPRISEMPSAVQEEAFMQELQALSVARRTSMESQNDFLYPRRMSLSPDQLNQSLLVMDADAKWKKQFSWVEGPTFSSIMLMLLMLNSLALAMETDHPSWAWWRLVNGAFLVLYVVEFTFRALYRGKEFLSSRPGWLLYDLLCVVLGTLDFLAACLFPGGLQVEGGTGGLPPEPTAGAMLLRGLMFTRLLRVVRILRLHGPLYSSVKLLTSMMKTYVWILIVIFVLDFVTAIVLTSLLAHGVLVDSEAAGDGDEGVSYYFADIPTSLFTVFQLTTAEDWSKIQDSVLRAAPLLRGFFICFIVFMSWTMLSLLTAVASETMISASSSKKQQEAMDQEVQRHSFSSFLCAEFVKADTDGNRVLDKEEFAYLMNQPQMKQAMKTHGIYLQDSDLLRTWDTFDIDESGELTIDELVTGFSYMQENLAMKHVANVCYSLKHFDAKMQSNIEILQRGADELARRQAHSRRMVMHSIAWQMKRRQLFRSEDMEELASGRSVSVPGASEAGNSEAVTSEKEPMSRFMGGWGFRAKVSARLQNFGAKDGRS